MTITSQINDSNTVNMESHQDSGYKIPDSFWDEVALMISEFDVAFDEELIQLKEQETTVETNNEISVDKKSPESVDDAESVKDKKVSSKSVSEHGKKHRSKSSSSSTSTTSSSSTSSSSSDSSTRKSRKKHKKDKKKKDKKKSKKKKGRRSRSRSKSMVKIEHELKKRMRESELLDEIERLEAEKRRRLKTLSPVPYEPFKINLPDLTYKPVKNPEPSTSKKDVKVTESGFILKPIKKVRSRSRSQSFEPFISGPMELVIPKDLPNEPPNKWRRREKRRSITPIGMRRKTPPDPYGIRRSRSKSPFSRDRRRSLSPFSRDRRSSPSPFSRDRRRSPSPFSRRRSPSPFSRRRSPSPFSRDRKRSPSPLSRGRRSRSRNGRSPLRRNKRSTSPVVRVKRSPSFDALTSRSRRKGRSRTISPKKSGKTRNYRKRDTSKESVKSNLSDKSSLSKDSDKSTDKSKDKRLSRLTKDDKRDSADRSTVKKIKPVSDDEDWDDLVDSTPKTAGAGYDMEQVKAAAKQAYGFDNDNARGGGRGRGNRGRGGRGGNRGGYQPNRVIRIEDEDDDDILMVSGGENIPKPMKENKPRSPPLVKEVKIVSRDSDEDWDDLVKDKPILPPAAYDLHEVSKLNPIQRKPSPNTNRKTLPLLAPGAIDPVLEYFNKEIERKKPKSEQSPPEKIVKNRQSRAASEEGELSSDSESEQPEITENVKKPEEKENNSAEHKNYSTDEPPTKEVSTPHNEKSPIASPVPKEDPATEKIKKPEEKPNLEKINSDELLPPGVDLDEYEKPSSPIKIQSTLSSIPPIVPMIAPKSIETSSEILLPPGIEPDEVDSMTVIKPLTKPISENKILREINDLMPPGCDEDEFLPPPEEFIKSSVKNEIEAIKWKKDEEIKLKIVESSNAISKDESPEKSKSEGPSSSEEKVPTTDKFDDDQPREDLKPESPCASEEQITTSNELNEDESSHDPKTESVPSKLDETEPAEDLEPESPSPSEENPSVSDKLDEESSEPLTNEISTSLNEKSPIASPVPEEDSAPEEPLPEIDLEKLLPETLIKEQQDEDIIYSRIKETIREDLPPTDEVRYLMEEYEPMGINDKGLLYREMEDQNLIIIPESLINDVIKSVHVIDEEKHLNEKQTTELLQGRYFWPFMTDTINDFILSCSNCSKL